MRLTRSVYLITKNQNLIGQHVGGTHSKGFIQNEKKRKEKPLANCHSEGNSIERDTSSVTHTDTCHRWQQSSSLIDLTTYHSQFMEQTQNLALLSTC